MSNASVPDAHVIQYLLLTYLVNFNSKSFTLLPKIKSPFLRIFNMSALILSFKSTYCLFKSINLIIIAFHIFPHINLLYQI